MMGFLRRPLVQYLASALLVLLVVTAGSVAWVAWAAQKEARQDAANAANSFARTVVSSLRVADLESSTHADTRAMLDRTVSGLLDEGQLYRVKIWQAESDGTARIVYSDSAELEGKRVDINVYLQEALDTREPVVVSVPTDAAHATEQRPGMYALEVYLTYEDADGSVAVAELYQTALISERIGELLVQSLPVAIGGPLLLTAFTFPLALRLTRRQAEAEALAREAAERALAASETERHRLAILLHDGPVQTWLR